MSVHHGKVVELAVRRKDVTISELSRRMHVNRRSIYNWFQQSSLRIEVICEIGYIIGYDFSQDFPKEFQDGGFVIVENLIQSERKNNGASNNSIQFWMAKYITLLEKYNELLLHHEHQPELMNDTKQMMFN